MSLISPLMPVPLQDYPVLQNVSLLDYIGAKDDGRALLGCSRKWPLNECRCRLVHRMCLYVDSTARGTNVMFEFEFGDGSQQIPTDVVNEEHTTAARLSHVYRNGEH